MTLRSRNQTRRITPLTAGSVRAVYRYRWAPPATEAPFTATMVASASLRLSKLRHHTPKNIRPHDSRHEPSNLDRVPAVGNGCTTWPDLGKADCHGDMPPSRARKVLRRPWLHRDRRYRAGDFDGRGKDDRRAQIADHRPPVDGDCHSL